MSALIKIRSALVSVYHKDMLEPMIRLLHRNGVVIYSTGGTQSFIQSLGIPVTGVEELTGYPSILGGRVKTLHPKVFGGILARREQEDDRTDMMKFGIPAVDMVVVDLYPFRETVASGAAEQEIIEKIDIGGISLIRAAAKNYRDVLIVSHRSQYAEITKILEEKEGCTDLTGRQQFATMAFHISSDYDTAIFRYFNREGHFPVFKESSDEVQTLRYGENPHQSGRFYGNLDLAFRQLHGKEISYNNLLDIDAAVGLIREFDETTVAILKHNNACGIASRTELLQAWKDALAGDPVSAFGGVIITNRKVDAATAGEMDKLFFEVILAPDYEEEALAVLKGKKNRIILHLKAFDLPGRQFRSLLNGVIVQDRDSRSETGKTLRSLPQANPAGRKLPICCLALRVVKHTKSNAIVLVKNRQLCASGVGQTSRVDALKQAIEKAGQYGFDLQGAVMASDAFFPFADSVEIAYHAGIRSVIQPGGSVRDEDSVKFCNEHGMSMIFTGLRHFKH
jgi:phosphoribosylaminoimidazolecarboxamide formyltransferase / IMP cyclohydrolase